jgi:type IV pilus assembly protein PilA
MIKRKKKNLKGFTLIELLVVVAIIGILAAVGVVAYSGYTAGAKKSAAKSNHATAIKYIAAELKKCDLDEPTVMNYKGTDQLKCAERKTANKVSAAAVAALADFKNPYLTTEKAIVAQAAPTNCALAANEGNTMLSDTGGGTNLVTIATCDVLAGTLLSDTVQIE